MKYKILMITTIIALLMMVIGWRDNYTVKENKEQVVYTMVEGIKDSFARTIEKQKTRLETITGQFKISLKELGPSYKSVWSQTNAFDGLLTLAKAIIKTLCVPINFLVAIYSLGFNIIVIPIAFGVEVITFLTAGASSIWQQPSS